MSDNNLALGDSKTTETISGSTTITTTVYSSTSEVSQDDKSGSEQEKISLMDKARLGFVSDQEAHGLKEAEPAHHSATPVKTTLTLDQVGNSAGALLRYHRERLGYSLQEIATHLKVRTLTVADLESDQLAQETAVNFTTGLLRRYSKLLNLDPNTVINLYMQKVTSMVKINQENRSQAGDSHMRRNLLIIVLILVVAGVGAGFALLDEGKIASPSSSTKIAASASGELGHDGKETFASNVSASAPSSSAASAFSSGSQGSNAAAAAAAAAADSGELTAGMELPMEVVSENLKLHDGEPAKPLTENTVKAQAQAVALSNQNEASIETAEQKPNSLPLNNETIARQQAAEASADKDAKNAKDGAQVAQADGKNQGKDQASNAGAGSTDAALAKNDDADAKAAAESSANAPSLNKSLKNISAQVKIVDRDNSIPSLNQVEITVLKDVALEVKSNSKTLKSGVFKAGEKIKLTSIPPFVVSVSDTTAVRINYLAGVLQTPKATQVTFELPTK